MENKFLDSLEGKKIGLVLSGGVVRAANWHLGVALALEELGFNLKGYKSKKTYTSESRRNLDINTYVGSSAGAMISTYFANGFGPQEIIDANIGKSEKLGPIKYSDMLYLKRPKLKVPNPNIFNPLEGLPFLLRKTIEPLLKTQGIFSAEGLKQHLKKNILKSESYEDYDVDFFVVATQLDNSRKVIFSKYNYPNPRHDSTSQYYSETNVSDSVAASMSIPLVYSPFPILNKITGEIDYYIDGEIRDTLSTNVAIDNGCEVIISSWTHTPYHYHDEVGSLVHYGLSAIAVQTIFLMLQKKIITSRAKFHTAIDTIKSVDSFLRSENFSETKRKEVVKILENKLGYKAHLKFIDIYPGHNDYSLFFTNLFSLNKKKMSEVIKCGYKKTMEVIEESK